MTQRYSEQKLGLACALTAFVIWGLVPVFFKLLADVDPLLVTAHRVIWALVMISVYLLLRDGRRMLQSLSVGVRVAILLMISALLNAINWLVFVWAISNDQVLATSLGYFINPLVNVLLGMLVFKERLRFSGWLAVVVAATGTLYLGISLGQAPWIALTLAFSFGFYGLVRKMLAVGPLVGLFWECLWLTPVALLCIFVLLPLDGALFGPVAPAQRYWLILSGLVTLVPLVLFAAAARRLPLTVTGFTQYLAPSISFCLAVFVYDEIFTPGHQVAFACIWSALVIYTLGPKFKRSSH